MSADGARLRPKLQILAFRVRFDTSVFECMRFNDSSSIINDCLHQEPNNNDDND